MGRQATLTTDRASILDSLYEFKTLTTQDVARYILPHKSKAAVEDDLHALLTCKFVTSFPLLPERGAASPRCFHLTAKGGRVRGRPHLSGAHYRVVNPVYHRTRQARLALRTLTRRTPGWSLYEREEDCRKILVSHLWKASYDRHGPNSQVDTFGAYLPQKVVPDTVVTMPTGLAICTIGHPDSGAGFWTRRLQQYSPFLKNVHAYFIGIVLTHLQKEDMTRAAASRHVEPFVGRIVVTNIKAMEKLPNTLTQIDSARPSEHVRSERRAL